MPDDNTIADKIKAAAERGIQSATGPTGSTNLMSVDDRIKADVYAKSNQAANRTGFGVRRRKIRFGGCG